VSVNDVMLLDQLSKPENEMILSLISIEEEIEKLELMLKDESIKNKEMIVSTAQEISSLARITRKKTVALLFEQENETLRYDSKRIVTDKEIKELLEDFA